MKSRAKKYDKKAYKFYVFNPSTNKIISAWEYKEDAKEHLQELSFTDLKVYTRTYLLRKKLNPELNKNWGTDLSGIKKKSKHEQNKDIEKFIDYKDFKGSSYSKSDIEYIQQYEGAGGKASQGAKGRALLDEFYTPDYIAEYMYKLAVKYGYKKGHILEPSIATGNIIKPFYKKKDFKSITAFEINPYTKRIAELTYPKIEIYLEYFETAFLDKPRFVSAIKNKKEPTWLQNYPFDLVIGNPPYGIHKNKYSPYFKGKDRFKQVETFFIYKGLQLLKKGGLLVYITSSNFMRTGTSNWAEKERMGQIAEFVDAYRLPKVFASSEVPTDILIFRRK